MNTKIDPDLIIVALTDQRNSAMNQLAISTALNKTLTNEIQALKTKLEETPEILERYIPDTTKE